MSLLKKLVILSICLGTSLHAEWDSSFLNQGDPTSAIILSNPNYTALKTQVTQALTNSWCSSEKINLLMDLTLLIHPKVCVEIGVFQGDSLLPVVTTLKFMNCGIIYAIDPWTNAEATKNLTDNDPNKSWWQSVNMRQVHRNFNDTLKKWSAQSLCIVLKMSSSKATSSIPEIDFLHIDGNYSADSSLEDVNLFLPKVKKGGYILFSNVNWCVNGTLPRIPAFQVLLNSCEIIARIDDGSSFLVRKL